MTSQAILRKKTLRAARTLEGVLGVPRQSRQLPPPLDMLIATILSQNTNDKNSHRAYTNLVGRYPTWKSVAEAPVRGIRSAIRTGGMATLKSLRIKETLAAVFADFGAYDLSPLDALVNDEIVARLVELKGVGYKTAACVLLFSLGRDVFPVDTHVHRLCSRLGLARDCTTPEQTYEAMKSLVPKGRGYSFHTNLIRFGRTICRPSNPLCGACPLYADCIYPQKSRHPVMRRVAPGADRTFMLLDNI